MQISSNISGQRHNKFLDGYPGAALRFASQAALRTYLLRSSHFVLFSLRFLNFPSLLMKSLEPFFSLGISIIIASIQAEGYPRDILEILALR